MDSSVWIGYFQGTITDKTEMLGSVPGAEMLATGDVILAEAFQGFKRYSEFELARGILTSLRAVKCEAGRRGRSRRKVPQTAQAGCNGAQDHRRPDCGAVLKEDLNNSTAIRISSLSPHSSACAWPFNSQQNLALPLCPPSATLV